MTTGSEKDKSESKSDYPDRSGVTQLSPLPKALTYAAVVDINNREIEITDSMVQQACREMASYEQFPFAPRKKPHR